MKKMIMVDPDDFFMPNRRDRGAVSFDELKAYKKFKKFLKKEEDEAKKNKKPDEPKTWFNKLSIAEKTIFFAVFGPPLGVSYVFGLLFLVRMLAEVAGVK